MRFCTEFITAVAALCQVIAGDNPSIGRVDAYIMYNQAACHAFYAKCLTGTMSNTKECMIKRNAELEVAARPKLRQ